MKFDVRGARKEGYSDAEIADYLANQRKFDLAGARKEGYSDTEIVDYLAKPKERHPFKAGFEAARSQLTEGLPYAVEKKFGTVTPEEEAAYSAKLKASNARQEELLPGGPASLGEDPLLSVIGENLAYSSPQMAASLGAGLVGGAVGTMVAPGPGTLAGAALPVLAGTAASTPFFVGSNVDRATAGGEEALTEEEAGRAMLAAPAQAAVDVVSDRFVPGMGRLLGAPAKKTAGKILQRTASGMLKGAASEGIAEPLQQVGERWAAGEELANQDALREYGQAAATAAILGGAMGGVGAQFEHKVEPHVDTNPEDQERAPGAPPPPDQGPYPATEDTFGMEREAEPVTEERFNTTRQDLMGLYGMTPDEASLAAARALGVPIKPEAPNAAGHTDVGGGEPSVPSAGRKRQGRRPAPEAPNPASEGLGAIVQPASGPPQGESPVGPALTGGMDAEARARFMGFNPENAEAPVEEEVETPVEEIDYGSAVPAEVLEAKQAKAPKGGGKNLTRKQREIMAADQLRLDRGFARNVLDDAPPPDTSHWTDPQTTASEPVVDTAVAATPEIAPVKAKKQRAATVPASVQETAEAPAAPEITSQFQGSKYEEGQWTVKHTGGEPLSIVNLAPKGERPQYAYNGVEIELPGTDKSPRAAGQVAVQMWLREQNAPQGEAAQGPEFEAPTADKFKGKPKIVAAEEALAAISTPNPLNERELLIGTPTGGVTLKVAMDGIHVHDLRAIERSGGRKALEAVLKIADDHGLQVGLNAVPGESYAGKKMTEAKLRAWYRGFGFEAERGGTYMVRKPQVAEQPAATAEKATPKKTPRRSRNEIGSYEETSEDGTKVQVRQFQSNVAKGAYKGATPARVFKSDPNAQEATTEDLTQKQIETRDVTQRINAALRDGFLYPLEATNLRNRLRKAEPKTPAAPRTFSWNAPPVTDEDSTTLGSGWHPKRVGEELTALLAKRPKPVVKGVNLSAVAGNTEFEKAPSRRDVLTGGAAIAASSSPAIAMERTPASSIKTVKDAIASGSLQRAIKAVATSETAPPHLKELARKLDLGGVGDAKITVEDYGDSELAVLGETDSKTGDVVLYKTSNGVSGDNIQTLLHEAIHAYIAKRYHSLRTYMDSNKKLVGTKDQVADPFIKEFLDLHEKFRNGIYGAYGSTRWADKLKTEVWLDEAARSPDEMLTRIFTDEDLRDFMKTIDIKGNPLSNGKSFWDHIVDAFCKLFGITKPNERSAFEEVLDSGNKVITAATQDKPTGEYAKKLTEYVDQQNEKTQYARAPGRPRRAQQTPPHVTTAANAPNNVPTPPSGFKSAARKAPKSWKQQGQRLLDVALQKLNYAYQGAVVADRYIANAMGAQPDSRKLDKAFELANSRKSNRKEIFVRRLVKPLIAKMAELKLDMHDVDMYLWARGAPGRNAAIARKNGGGGNGILAGSGLTDADAQAIIDEYRRRGMLADLDTIAAMHDRIVRFNLDTMVDAGLITRRTATAMLAAHPNYTPMTGIAVEGDITEDGEIDGGKADLKPKYYGSRTREFMSASGRESMPASPLTHLMQNVAGTIVRAENNRVGQVLVRLSGQNNLATDDVFHVLHSIPPGTSTAGYHVVKVGGAAKYVSFANTEAGNALKSAYLSLSPKDMGVFIKGWTNVANVMKRLMTTWNPAFLGTAFTRDVFDSLAAAKAAETDKTSPAYGKPLANEMRKYMNMEVFKGVMSYVAGKSPRPGTNEFRIHAALDSMAANGGSVGSTMLHNSEDFKDEIKKQLSDAAALNAKDPVGNAAKVLKIVGESMDRTAHAFDLFPRVATYMGALRTGMSQTDAARVSLNSSLNLTRRGEWARVLDNTFFFFSPTVEGARKFTKMGLTSANGTKLMATFAGIGGMATLMNSMIAGGDDDDDGRPNYMDVPKVTQQTRLVIFHGPGSDDYFSIPLGFMMAYPTYVGTRATQALLGAASGESAGVMMAEAAGDLATGLASSMSPLRPSGDQVQESVASLAPSMAKPFTDLAVNKNYFGSNIYNKQFDSRIARSTMGRESTGKVWEWLATTLNESTGGSGNTAGWMDLQPEQYRYLFEAYAGGPYRTIKDSVKAFDGGNEETGLARVPIIRGFVGKGSEYVPMNQYFKNTKEMASLEYSERTSDPEVWEKQVKKFPVDTDPRIMDAYVGAEKELDALRRFRLNELRSTEDTKEKRDIIKEYRELNREVYADFNKTYNEVRKDIQNSGSAE